MTETFENTVARIAAELNYRIDDKGMALLWRLRDELAKGQEPVAYFQCEEHYSGKKLYTQVVEWANGDSDVIPLYTRPVVAAPAITSDATCKTCNGEGSWEAAASSTSHFWKACPDCKAAPAGVLDGWKLVPVKPTVDMVDAALEVHEPLEGEEINFRNEFRRTYRAMLSAAPAAPADAVAKDAERYRWLRDDANQLHEDEICVSDSSFNTFFGEELDAAIDAAMAASRE